MAALTAQNTSISGLTATYAAVAASDTFSNTGNIILHVKNGDGSANTVGVVSTQTINGLAVADVAVTIAGGAEAFIGIFKGEIFNATLGVVTVTHTNTTSNTIAVIKVV
jgi:hypothetical protein